MARDEYGKPTFGHAVLARLGIGTGYTKPKKGKVEGGPASPYGPYKTRQEQLEAQEAEAEGYERRYKAQSTDSNN